MGVILVDTPPRRRCGKSPLLVILHFKLMEVDAGWGVGGGGWEGWGVEGVGRGEPEVAKVNDCFLGALAVSSGEGQPVQRIKTT